MHAFLFSIMALFETIISIRALFGTDGTKNAAHGSDSPTSASREIALIFAPTSEAAKTTSVKDLSAAKEEKTASDAPQPSAA